MTNPTDTNQASEDELSVEIDGYIDDIRYNNEVPFDERLESAKKSIHHLVRADRKKHELQARLSEGIYWQTSINDKTTGAERISKLKQELETLL